jgi:hypothetical protein
MPCGFASPADSVIVQRFLPGRSDTPLSPVAAPVPRSAPTTRKITVRGWSTDRSPNPSVSVFSQQVGPNTGGYEGGYMRNTAVEHLRRRELSDATRTAEWVDATPHRAPAA